MPPATQLQSSGGNYLLHAGDDLEITFFYNPELNQHAAVRPDGRISMPLIGDVQAEGLTVPKLTEVLEAAYNPELKRSNLSIQLRATPNQVYYVGGEVTRPGVLPLRGATVTALQAIIEAGGLKDSAAQGGISILRRSPSGAIELHTIALKSKKGVISESAQFELQPLDVLIVSETRINKLDRMMEQYVKRLSPVLMTGGFTYLFGSTTTVP
jgi:protein involved in polysaccharide export with SLBB domain